MTMKSYKRVLGTVLICFALSQNAHAKYCPKCVKIESEREAEQEKNGPQKDKYYDDFIEGDEKTNEEPKDAAIPAKKIYEPQNEVAEDSPGEGSPGRGNAPLGQKDLAGIAAKDVTSGDQAAVQENPSGSGQVFKKMMPMNQVSAIFDVLTIKNLFNVFEGPFTIFVPSDQAIQKIPLETFTNMLKIENRELLYSLITNHIVPEQILRNNFNKPFKTLGGRLIELRSNGNALSVNGARVLKSESIGNSGVVYEIDQVFIPIYFRE